MTKPKKEKTPKAPKPPKFAPFNPVITNPKAKSVEQELGLAGPGVEPLVIAEIEKFAEEYTEARDQRMGMKEVEDEKQAALMLAMNRHRDRLVKEDGGGVSYRYGARLVVLKPSSEKVTVKSIHEVVEVGDEDSET